MLFVQHHICSTCKLLFVFWRKCAVCQYVACVFSPAWQVAVLMGCFRFEKYSWREGFKSHSLCHGPKLNWGSLSCYFVASFSMDLFGFDSLLRIEIIILVFSAVGGLPVAVVAASTGQQQWGFYMTGFPEFSLPWFPLQQPFPLCHGRWGVGFLLKLCSQHCIITF